MVRVGGPGIIVRRNLLCSIYNFGLLTITTTFLERLLGQEGTRKTASSWNYLTINKRLLYEITMIKLL